MYVQYVRMYTYVCVHCIHVPVSPLQHYAVASEAPKRKATVELLIKKKADVNAQNKELLTPLHCATDKAHMDALEVLVKHGTNVSGPLCVYTYVRTCMYVFTYMYVHIGSFK